MTIILPDAAPSPLPNPRSRRPIHGIAVGAAPATSALAGLPSLSVGVCHRTPLRILVQQRLDAWLHLVAEPADRPGHVRQVCRRYCLPSTGTGQQRGLADRFCVGQAL